MLNYSVVSQIYTKTIYFDSIQGEQNMNLSETQKNFSYVISWDNPDPADSSTMYASLGALGHVTRLVTETSATLHADATTKEADVRNAIVKNLHAANGNAFYVKRSDGTAHQISTALGLTWISIP